MKAINPRKFGLARGLANHRPPTRPASCNSRLTRPEKGFVSSWENPGGGINHLCIHSVTTRFMDVDQTNPVANESFLIGPEPIAVHHPSAGPRKLRGEPRLVVTNAGVPTTGPTGNADFDGSALSVVAAVADSGLSADGRKTDALIAVVAAHVGASSSPRLHFGGLLGTDASSGSGGGANK